jgi:hypothetical protein
MSISAVDFEIIADPIASKDPIYCSVSKEERGRLFQAASRISRFFQRYIFPLSHVEDAVHKELLEREDWISTELFWSAPFNDLRYPKQKEVREGFDRYNQTVVIQSEGKKIEVNCRVIETKGCPKTGGLNHIIVHGNSSTLNNNMPGVYPFLETYLQEKAIHPDLPPARFIFVNHYGNTMSSYSGSPAEVYYPTTIDEWSVVFKKTLESFVDEYGQLHFLSAHSLGNLPVIEHLKNLGDEEFLRLFPRVLLLSNGPSSLYEVSANIPVWLEWYPWGRCFLIGWIFYYLFKAIGWNIELDKTLVDRIQRLPNNAETVEKLKKTKIFVTEVAHDVYFPGTASLCASDQLNRLEGVVHLSRMTFNPPLAWGIPRAQHNVYIGLLQRQDLIQEKRCNRGESVVHLKDPKTIISREVDQDCSLRHGESLPQAVLRSAWAEELASSSVALNRHIIPFIKNKF